MTLIADLAKEPRFVNLTPVSGKSRDERVHEELVTRLFAYSDGLSGYKDRPSEFLFNYVKEMNQSLGDNPSLEGRYRSRFAETIDFVERVFPHGFRKSPAGRATPKARFEAIAVGARLALDKRPSLANETVGDVGKWLDSKEFKRVTGSDGANAVARLKERTQFVRDRLLGTAK